MSSYYVYLDSKRKKSKPDEVEAERVEILDSGVLAFYDDEPITDADGVRLQTVNGGSEPVAAYNEWHSYEQQ